MILPSEALPLLAALAPAFTRPTFRRFTLLLAAAILTQGRHTVANLLRTLGGLAPGHRTDYQRVLSRAPWSGLRLGCALARFIVDRLCPAGPVVLVGDDTVDGHPGRHVYGKARHRDPVRSSHAYTAWKYGHRWVVLAVLVRFPWAPRPWALPVLVDLYRSEEDDRRRGRPHRTPAQLMCRLLRLLMMRLPGRRFVFVGDSGYGTHEVARFAHRHRGRLVLVSKLHPEANLFDPPPPYRGNGRPRVKGGRRPRPREAVEAARRRRRLTVGWYGGGTRRVSVVTGAGHWYKAGDGLVPLRWVHVRDLEGTHRDEYFYATDPTLDPGQLVTHYAGRWNIECTFQEGRACLRSETTRGWCPRTVLRAAPCLFGLYSVVALLYHALPEAKRSGGVRWPGKAGVTFSDALASVRLWIWAEGVFPRAGGRFGLEKLPDPLRDALRSALAPAA
jgi:hypothetical protein